MLLLFVFLWYNIVVTTICLSMVQYSGICIIKITILEIRRFADSGGVSHSDLFPTD